MKKFLLLLMMVLCGTIAMWSKQNPVKGYIITNSGDTISGTIDYQTRGKMARACHFKPNGESSFITYEPGQIAGFRLMDADGLLETETDPRLFF